MSFLFAYTAPSSICRRGFSRKTSRRTAMLSPRVFYFVLVVSLMLWSSRRCKAEDKPFVHHPERDPSTPQSVEGGI
jgi:hypothetical protein